MKLSSDTINELQKNAENIRNICILAHVDHGKTSLSDSLLATNGIISQRLAGKVRYLDSREDEQLRGITMEASAISLYFKVVKKSLDEQQLEKLVENQYLINLIDSPGHIDFSSEVSTSSRLCDGAVVVVDIIEGVCSQTVNVLRQCWVDKLKPVLVLNKIDRLIIEWKYTPEEAEQHIARTIEQVNSVLGLLFAGDRMEDDLIWRESGQTTEFVEKTDDDIYFAPEKNNVIFTSAMDGWGFSVNTFAKIYAAKLGFSHKALMKTLWGDFYLDMKNKKIVPGKKLTSKQSHLKTLFVSLVLEPLWSVYDSCLINRDEDKIGKIISKLGVKVSPRDLRSKDYKSLLGVIMSQWVPLSHALLGSVIECLPSPIESQRERMGKLLEECVYNVKSDVKLDSEIEESIINCASKNPERTLVAYVSKLVSVPDEELPKEYLSEKLTAEQLMEKSRKARELAKKASEDANAAAATKENEVGNKMKDPFEWEMEDEDFEYEDFVNSEDDEEESNDDNQPETLIAFTRIFAGSLTKGQKVTVVGPKYDASLPNDDEINKDQITRDVIIQDLYLIMGREFVKMDTVPAGNIVGVVGLGHLPLKNATILSNEAVETSINLASTSTLIHNKPIMKIAVEPVRATKLGKLERGLTKLAKADPVLEWYTDDDSGELIMCVAGELHLERCLKDLEERFAKGCEVTVKEPVIPFREGLISNKKIEERSKKEFNVQLGNVELDFEVVPLPTKVVKFLSDNESLIYDTVVKKKSTNLPEEFMKLFEDEDNEGFDHGNSTTCKEFFIWSGFKDGRDLMDHLLSFGPKRIGANILLESKGLNKFKKLFRDGEYEKFKYENNVLNGFQLATNEGPLTSEQLIGTAIIIKEAKIIENEDEVLGGRIFTFTRDFIHRRFFEKGPRLFLAMYTCEIQAQTEVLGKVYNVVQQRGGTIISEEMKEGTPFFTIVARIPVIKAFGFSEDIRKKTSGAASPQLVFDGFDVLDIDPFWVPHTEEELEELGEFAERENVARKYMNDIRRRKGLFVDEKVVQNAEKQRTLKKD